MQSNMCFCCSDFKSPLSEHHDEEHSGKVLSPTISYIIITHRMMQSYLWLLGCFFFSLLLLLLSGWFCHLFLNHRITLNLCMCLLNFWKFDSQIIKFYLELFEGINVSILAFIFSLVQLSSCGSHSLRTNSGIFGSMWFIRSENSGSTMLGFPSYA